jgi:hypothetical protein
LYSIDETGSLFKGKQQNQAGLLRRRRRHE